MEVLLEAKEIRKAIRKIHPSKIAVAYVGIGWKKYISLTSLKEIVISPTPGSNPKAIEEIMQTIGPENVYFLDKLHSKMYLGKDNVIIGSCNLSDSAMTESGLLEVAVISGETRINKELQKTFEEYKKEAKRLYPTLKSKKERLHVLLKQWDTSVWYGIIKDNSVESSLLKYESEIDKIHISPFFYGDLEFNDEAIATAVPDASGISAEEYFEERLNFLEEEPIEPGDWILMWHSNNDGFPRVNGKIKWMRAHSVVPNGVIDERHTKLVGQAKNLNSGVPPFKLDQNTKTAIRNAISSGEFQELILSDDAIWKTKQADKVRKKFLQYVRQELESNAKI